MPLQSTQIGFDDLPTLVGKTAYVSDWMSVDREHLQMFAKSCYLDPEHVDLSFSKNNAFGSDLVDGFLILSMLIFWNFKDFPLRGERIWGLNYGLNKVRWIVPVMVGDKIRAECKVTAMEPRGDGWLGTLDVTVVKEGAERPAMKAEWLCLFKEGDLAQ
jgi:acyl dehydratase